MGPQSSQAVVKDKYHLAGFWPLCGSMKTFKTGTAEMTASMTVVVHFKVQGCSQLSTIETKCCMKQPAVAQFFSDVFGYVYCCRLPTLNLRSFATPLLIEHFFGLSLTDWDDAVTWKIGTLKNEFVRDAKNRNCTHRKLVFNTSQHFRRCQNLSLHKTLTPGFLGRTGIQCSELKFSGKKNAQRKKWLGKISQRKTMDVAPSNCWTVGIVKLFENGWNWHQLKIVSARQTDTFDMPPLAFCMRKKSTQPHWIAAWVCQNQQNGHES